MRFRTAIALAISLALALALTATVIVVSVALDHAARRELGRELERGRTVFEDLLRYRKSLHHAESRVLADEPRLKAVVATDDVTTTTVLGVVADLRRALRCDLLLMTDRSGKLLADAAHPEESGEPLGDNPVIESTLTLGEAEGVWLDGAQAFQIQGRRLMYGSMTVGAVVVGFRIDDALGWSWRSIAKSSPARASKGILRLKKPPWPACWADAPSNQPRGKCSFMECTT
jgi:sigma-B regulation protein RsbU (phosphoserine phosphatase)